MADYKTVVDQFGNTAADLGLSTPKGYYTVKPGDSPVSVAQAIYGDGRMFAELMSANGGAPFKPGMQLYLPPKQSNPFVSNETAAAFGMATEGQKFTGTLGTSMNNSKGDWTQQQLANRQAAYDVAGGKYKTIGEALAGGAAPVQIPNSPLITDNLLGASRELGYKPVLPPAPIPGAMSRGEPASYNAQTPATVPPLPKPAAPSGYSQRLQNAPPGTSGLGQTWNPMPENGGPATLKKAFTYAWSQPTPGNQISQSMVAKQPATTPTPVPVQAPMKTTGGPTAQNAAQMSPTAVSKSQQMASNQYVNSYSAAEIVQMAASYKGPNGEKGDVNTFYANMIASGFTKDASGNLTRGLPSLKENQPSAAAPSEYTVPDNWWPGMFGLYGNKGYYQQSPTYTGRSNGNAGNSYGGSGNQNMNIPTG